MTALAEALDAAQAKALAALSVSLIRCSWAGRQPTMTERKSLSEFREFVVNLDVTVTAPSEEEALAALERSGIRTGALIGEALIGNVGPPEEY